MVPGSSSVVCTEELGAKKPEDLAVVLGDDLDRYVRVVGKIYSQVQAVRNTLSKAQGVQRAMQTQFNKAAVEVQQEAAAAQAAKAQGEPKPEGAATGNAKPAARKTAAKQMAPGAKVVGAGKSPARKAPAQKKAEPATAPAKKAEAAAGN